ncbi:MAG: hypothetical protein KF805_11405 [Phycisphaeraceae bacterium]|nr:hypothetical protein [Phycisphaeraceae bacterium]
MSIRRPPLVLLALSLALSLAATIARAQNQSFTYQGKLAESGAPATGAIDLTVKLFNTDTGGSPIGSQTINGVPLIGGVFTITLNAGGEFTANPFATGADLWVEITVNGQTISPRQKLTVAPMAAFSAAPWVLNGTTLSYTGGNVAIGSSIADRPLTVNAPSFDIFGVRSAQMMSFQADQVTRWHLNLYDPFSAITPSYGLNFSESGVSDFRFFLAKGGNIGIGTPTPTGRLEIASLNDALVIRPPDLSSGQSARIAFKDPDNSTPTTLLLFKDTGFPNLSVNSTTSMPARLGVNTTDPTKALDVRGEIAFGPAGQFSPVGSGAAPARVVFALIDGSNGSIYYADGVTVARTGVGRYTVTFQPSFSSYPAVSITPVTGASGVTATADLLSNVQVTVYLRGTGGLFVDTPFSIFAIGPR